MTRKEAEVLATPYFDGLKWHRDVGHPFDTSGLDERTAAKLRDKGYLVTAAAYKARTNPEAAQAQQQVETHQAELDGLYTLFPGVTTVPGLEQAIKALRGQVPSAEAAEQHLGNAGVVSALMNVYPDATTGQELLDAVKTSRDAATQTQTLLALYATTGGTELPPNFNRRGKLAALGLTTYESLRGKTAAQLNAVEGVTLEDAGQIVGKVEAHFAQQE